MYTFAKKQKETPAAGQVLQRKDNERQPMGFTDNRPKVAAQPKENKTGLPDRLKEGVESLSGLDMSGVRVHRNSPEPAAVHAHAYTQGSNIYLGPGQERHLPHESWHVVQQARGKVRPTVQIAGRQVNDNHGLEKEADIMGNTANKAGLHGGANNLPPAAVSPSFNTSGNVKQCKLIKWQNPALKKDVIDGLSTAQKKANKLDDATVKGRDILQDALDKVNDGTITQAGEFKNEFSAISGSFKRFIDNFTNRLEDYRNPSTKKIPPPNKEAGYIIEAYASEEAKAIGDISTQYVLGGSRPDFKVLTGEHHTFQSKVYKADAFVDITSKAEAVKGHISEKITKVSTMEDVKNHPHLWDSFYEPIDWGTGAKAVPMITDVEMKEREARKADEAESASRKRKALRSSDTPSAKVSL